MNLLQKNLDRYINDDDFLRLIGEHEICILSEFLLNKEGIETFWQKYYGGAVPRVVLCGINPVRHDVARDTGIPFLDYQSLSQLVSGIDRQDSDPTARFFFWRCRIPAGNAAISRSTDRTKPTRMGASTSHSAGHGAITLVAVGFWGSGGSAGASVFAG